MVFANHYCIRLSSNDITDMSGLFPLIGDIFHWATDHALYLYHSVSRLTMVTLTTLNNTSLRWFVGYMLLWQNVIMIFLRSQCSLDALLH